MKWQLSFFCIIKTIKYKIVRGSIGAILVLPHFNLHRQKATTCCLTVTAVQSQWEIKEKTLFTGLVALQFKWNGLALNCFMGSHVKFLGLFQCWQSTGEPLTGISLSPFWNVNWPVTVVVTENHKPGFGDSRLPNILTGPRCSARWAAPAPGRHTTATGRRPRCWNGAGPPAPSSTACPAGSCSRCRFLLSHTQRGYI